MKEGIAFIQIVHILKLDCANTGPPGGNLIGKYSIVSKPASITMTPLNYKRKVNTLEKNWFIFLKLLSIYLVFYPKFLLFSY
jgi:hypothetical protein